MYQTDEKKQTKDLRTRSQVIRGHQWEVAHTVFWQGASPPLFPSSLFPSSLPGGQGAQQQCWGSGKLAWQNV